MESNGIFVLVEPAYVMPVWFEKGILGLQKSAARKRLPLHLISPEELSDCRGKTKSAIVVSSRSDWTLGVQAVNLWDLLEYNPNLDAINILLHGELVCRGSTAYQNPPPYESFHSSTAREHPELSIGKVNRTIRGLENCLLQCDQLDFGIIREIILGSSLEDTAEALFISQGTLRYRLKKMYQAAGVSSRQELERILKRYVTNHQVFDELLNAPAP